MLFTECDNGGSYRRLPCKQSPSPDHPGAEASPEARAHVPASSAQGKPGVGGEAGQGWVSESGFTMNVDWHQEATSGPQSLLKPLAGGQGSPSPAAQGAQCRQPVRSRGAPWHPGGNNIFQNAQANSPVMGDSEDQGPALPSPPSQGSPPSLQSARLPLLLELGTRPFVWLHCSAQGVHISQVWLLPTVTL